MTPDSDTVTTPPSYTVTVIAMALNYEQWVIGALNAIAAQTLTDIQLVITDDASTDRTPELVRAWAGQAPIPTQFIAHRARAGLCPTLNEALALARGEFIAIVSLDDIWQPDHLSLGVAAFADARPGTAVVFSDVDLIDYDGKPRGVRLLRDQMQLGSPAKPVPTGDVFRDLIPYNFVPANSAIIRASALAEVGMYDESLAFEDYDMWFRLATRYPFHYIPGSVTASWRVYSTSHSHQLRLQRQHLDSEYRVLAKALGHDDLSDQLIRQRMLRLARAAYFSGQPEGREHLRSVTSIEYTLNAQLLGKLAALPIPPAVFRHTRNAARTIRRRLRPFRLSPR